MAANSYTIEQIKELADALGIGQKHDVSSTTPTAQGLYSVNPGNVNQQGPFTTVGVRPQMYDATTRVRSFASMIPLRPSVYRNERIEILTGVTNPASIANSTDACAAGPEPGNLKTCQQVSVFGIIHTKSKIFDITKVGERYDRAVVDRSVYNTAANQTPWLPQVPGIDGEGRVASQMRSSFYTMGMALERGLGPVMFNGVAATENNTYYGVARQWNGLDALIKTGYTDAVNGAACPAADSVVESFNAAVDGTHSDGSGRNIVQSLIDLYFAVMDRGQQVGMGGVNYAFIMRQGLFRALCDNFSCLYAVTSCASGAVGSPVQRDGMAVTQFRDNMWNGMFIPILGQHIPVVFDDSIPKDSLANKRWKGDIYLVPTDWNGQSLLYGEYFPMNNAEAMELETFMGAAGSETTTVNNGLYRVFRRTTGGCYEFDFYGKVRLMLDAPFLAGRLDDVFYYSFAAVRDPQPGASNYQDGGTTLRLRASGGAW